MKLIRMIPEDWLNIFAEYRIHPESKEMKDLLNLRRPLLEQLSKNYLDAHFSGKIESDIDYVSLFQLCRDVELNNLNLEGSEEIGVILKLILSFFILSGDLRLLNCAIKGLELYNPVTLKTDELFFLLNYQVRTIVKHLSKR